MKTYGIIAAGVIVVIVLFATGTLNFGSSSPPKSSSHATRTTPTTSTGTTPTPGSTTPTSTSTGTTSTTGTTPTPTSTTPATTITTGGGTMPTTTTGGTATSTSTTGTTSASSCTSGGHAVSDNGFTAAATLTGPVMDGGTAHLDLTICKVSGDDVPWPAITVGTGWDSHPSPDFAKLALPAGVYGFWDQSKDWFQPGRTLSVGDTYEISGTIDVPARSSSNAYFFCVFVDVSGLSEHTAYDDRGNPKPSWTDSVGPGPLCWPYTVR